MAGTQIAQYSAGFSFELNNGSITRLNAQIAAIKKNIQQRFENITIGDGMKIKSGSLNKALKIAAADIVLPINNFSVNIVALRRQVQAAFDTGVVLKVNATQGGTRNAAAAGKQSNLTKALGMGGGGLGGLVNTLFPVATAGYSIAKINEISQELQAGRLSLDTVTKGRGQETYQWLKDASQEMGFDYRKTLPIFSNFMASSQNKFGYEGSLTGFKNLTSYGLTHGATNVSMERAMLAFSQMSSKGKVMSEELTRQLAEATGFGGARELFAKAYAAQTHSGATGQKSEADLMATMKAGKVLSRDLLPIVFKMMGEEAKSGMGAYKNTTAFQHNQFNNAYSSMIERFGGSGFDRGMARIFETLAGSLTGSNSLVDKLGEAFNQLSIVFSGVVRNGKMLLDFFSALNPFLSSTALLGTLLYKVIGRMGFAFLALVLVFDEIRSYVSGEDSVLGDLVKYMTDLTGLDFNSIAAGLGVVGLAILAMTSPITAMVAALAVAVGLFERVEAAKAAKLVQKNVIAGMPTSQLSGVDTGPQGSSGIVSSILGYGLSMANSGRVKNSAWQTAFDKGQISKADWQKMAYLEGSGQITSSRAMDWLKLTTSAKENPFVTAKGDQAYHLSVENMYLHDVGNLTEVFEKAGAAFPSPVGKAALPPAR